MENNFLCNGLACSNFLLLLPSSTSSSFSSSSSSFRFILHFELCQYLRLSSLFLNSGQFLIYHSNSSLENWIIMVCYWWSLFICSVVSDTLWPPWTIAGQAPLPMGFSRQEYWSGLPFPSPGDLPNPGIEPRSPALQANSVNLSYGNLIISATKELRWKEKFSCTS